MHNYEGRGALNTTGKRPTAHGVYIHIRHRGVLLNAIYYSI
jgi:hypothetical protein